MRNPDRSVFSHLPGWNISQGSKLSWIFILIIFIIAILGSFIANEKPYYCKLEGKSYFPLLSGINEASLSNLHPEFSPVNWYTTSFETIWYAPVPYSHFTIDLKAGKHVSPFDKQDSSWRLRHWLGTDLVGRDVMAGMIRGCRVSLLIGLGSMLLALLIGVPFGSAAAYWGNRHWKGNWFQIITGVMVLLIFLYLVWLPFTAGIKILLTAALLLVTALLLYVAGKLKLKKISIPVDHMVMSLVSIIDSFPGLFIIVILLVIIPFKGWLVVMGAIALLRWPVMARYMRAEVFKIKESNYIKAVQILNVPTHKILSAHIIPYAFRPVMISFIFGVSSAILAESSLSFLGIGLPPGEINWGRLLSQSRNHFDAWWLLLFPGAAIFFTLLSLYTIGDAVKKEMDLG